MWPALISGAAGLLGNFFSSSTSAANTQAQIAAQQQMQLQTMNYNAEEALRNRAFQHDEATRQMNWQEIMSGTAYRRAQNDMREAGLNPILAASGGSPSSTPSGAAGSGSQASVGTPTVPMPQNKSPFEGLGKVVQDAVNTAIAVTTQEKMVDEIANLRTSRKLTEAQIVSEQKTPQYREELTETERKRQNLLHREAQTEAEETIRREAAGRREQQEVGRTKALREQEEVRALKEKNVNQELYENWLTRRFMQLGILGKSASDVIAPTKEVLETVGIGNAKRLWDMDLGKQKLRDRLQLREIEKMLERNR